MYFPFLNYHGDAPRQAARRLPARARSALVDREDAPIKPSSTSTNPSSSAGGVAALRKRSALVDMTNRRVFGGAATSESVQSSGKEASSGAISRGKLALRDSNVSTIGASRNGKATNGKATVPATTTSQGVKAVRQQPSVDTSDRPVRPSKRATTATGIPARTKSASVSINSRSNSVQSTASQRATTTLKTVAGKDDRGVKRIKTDRGEKRVNAVGLKDNDVGHLMHKKSRAVQEEVKEEGPAKDEGWEDLDTEDADDPLMVAEYVNEIFDYMKELEVRFRQSRLVYCLLT